MNCGTTWVERQLERAGAACVSRDAFPERFVSYSALQPFSALETAVKGSEHTADE
jgi:hypothetical protein